MFRIKTLMTSHPKMFEKKFVGYNSTVTKKEVKDLIRSATSPGNNELQLLQALGIFIDDSSEDGKLVF